MHSSLIGKIEKAKLYACEPTRFSIGTLNARVRGDNGEHQVGLSDGSWTCTCDFFPSHGICSHTMALEKLLQGMVPSQGVEEPLATS